MFKNYIKIAWRNLAKSKAYSSINVIGLAIGMAVALLISLWILDEVYYNKNFKNYDSVVRVMENSTHGTEVSTFSSTPIPLSVEMRTKYASDFKAVALASWNLTHVLSFSEKQLSKDGMFVEPEMVDIFSLNLIKGSKKCLNDPSSIILSSTLAKAMFGNDDPMNKTVKIDSKNTLTVTGVYEDFPHNSEFRPVTFLAPWAYFRNDQQWVKNSESNWDNNSFQMFAQLQPNADLNKVSAKIKGALTGHERRDKPEVVLHPMSKWHLYSDFKNGYNVGGSIQFVWMFGIIGFFVLLLACINFMNLSTARSEKRAKEVGIRKAIGSARKQLVLQFLGESILIAFLALFLAIFMVQLSLSWFNTLSNKQMSILWSNPLFWASIIGFTFFTGLISGSYPALYLSSFNPIKALKGTFKAGRFASIPRKVLVVLQFSVSVSLIIGTVVIYQQIEYAKDRPVGYTRAGLITINMNTPALFGHYNIMRNDLLNSGAAVDFAESGSPVTGVYSHQSGFEWEGKDPGLMPSFGVVSVTHDFGKTIGWQFADGRDFSRNFSSDTASMVLNEAAVKYMGLTKPVGATVVYTYSSRTDKNYHVVGVIKDMVMDSPFEPAKPVVYMMDYDNVDFITVKINPLMSVGKALPLLEKVFKKYNPDAPFEYTFADADYSRKFAAEERIGRLATFFAAFAIFISCLGLFGLASFMAEQRTKEIGVRKVLGASVANLWGLLSKDFILLVFISFFIAIPLAWYTMNNWLQNYEYRTTISLWIFTLTAFGALLITLITVSFQAIKAALANPVKSLRTE